MLYCLTLFPRLIMFFLRVSSLFCHPDRSGKRSGEILHAFRLLLQTWDPIRFRSFVISTEAVRRSGEILHAFRMLLQTWDPIRFCSFVISTEAVRRSGEILHAFRLLLQTWDPIRFRSFVIPTEVEEFLTTSEGRDNVHCSLFIFHLAKPPFAFHQIRHIAPYTAIPVNVIMPRLIQLFAGSKLPTSRTHTSMIPPMAA